MFFGNAKILSDTGSLSIKHERIAEIINDLDPELRLAWIPPDKRSAFDKHPFAIIHMPEDGREPYIALTCSEDEVDERLIAKLIMRDTRQGFSIDKLDAEDRARRLIEAKDKLEEFEEAAEFAKSVWKSRKSVYRHNGVEYR